MSNNTGVSVFSGPCAGFNWLFICHFEISLTLGKKVNSVKEKVDKFNKSVHIVIS